MRRASYDVTYHIRAIESDRLSDLVASTTHRKGNPDEHVFANVIKFYANPDIVVLDLALTEAETKLIATNGGTDRFCRTPDKTGGALEQLTGFNLIKSFLAHRCAVIVTSYSSNPLVETLCLKQGANAFVRKPFTAEAMAEASAFLELHKLPKVVVDYISELEKSASAKDKQKKWDVAKRKMTGIDNYVTKIANEVLKQYLIHR